MEYFKAILLGFHRLYRERVMGILNHGTRHDTRRRCHVQKLVKSQHFSRDKYIRLYALKEQVNLITIVNKKYSFCNLNKNFLTGTVYSLFKHLSRSTMWQSTARYGDTCHMWHLTNNTKASSLYLRRNLTTR